MTLNAAKMIVEFILSLKNQDLNNKETSLIFLASTQFSVWRILNFRIECNKNDRLSAAVKKKRKQNKM